MIICIAMSYRIVKRLKEKTSGEKRVAEGLFKAEVDFSGK